MMNIKEGLKKPKLIENSGLLNDTCQEDVSSTTSFQTAIPKIPGDDSWMDENVNLDKEVKIETSDDLLKMCGDAGVWQTMVFLLGSLCGLNTAIQSFIYTFIGDIPDHWCTLPDMGEDEYTEEDLKALLIPKDKSGSFEKCFQYPYTLDGITGQLIVDRSQQVKCNSTEFALDIFTSTIATEWNLVCDDAVWVSTVQASFMFGILVGSIVFGWLSDKIGRKRTIWICTFLFLISSPMVGLAPNFFTLMIFRFILGTTAPGVYSASYVLVVEVVGSKRRGLAGSLFCIPFSVGYMMLPVIAYFIRDWRNLQLTCSSLSLILLISWWYLPESPRWLLIKGRAKEAEVIFRQMAKTNGKLSTLPKNFSNLVQKIAFSAKEVAPKSCLDRFRDYSLGTLSLLRTPKLRLRTLVLAVAFTAITLVYYGIALNASNLEIDKFLFTFLCGAFEIPSDLLIPILIGSVGRRMAFSGLLLTCGLLLLTSLLLTTGSVMAIILAVCALIAIASDSTLIYLYSSELFPTPLRTYGLGFSAMLGRTGGIAAPYIVEVLGEEHKSYPTIIFGGVSVVAGLLTLLLPETKNKKLPETVEEIESS